MQGVHYLATAALHHESCDRNNQAAHPKAILPQLRSPQITHSRWPFRSQASTRRQDRQRGVVLPPAAPAVELQLCGRQPRRPIHGVVAEGRCRTADRSRVAEHNI